MAEAKTKTWTPTILYSHHMLTSVFKDRNLLDERHSQGERAVLQQEDVSFQL